MCNSCVVSFGRDRFITREQMICFQKRYMESNAFAVIIYAIVLQRFFFR